MKASCCSSLRLGSRYLLKVSAIGLVSLPMLALSVAADPRPSGTDLRTSIPLRELLIAESQGTAVDRATALANLKSSGNQQEQSQDKESSADAVHWHSGELLHNGGWISASELDADSPASMVAKYYKMRGDNTLDGERHRTLARWCKSHGLESQARAHWFGVLESDGSDLEARQTLGFVLVGNRWFSPEEMSAIAARSKTAIESLRQWMPKVREWVTAIEGNDGKKRLKAIQQLRGLKDPKAVVALSAAIGQVSSDAAIHFIQTIGRFQTREACASLAGISIADPSSETGVAAIEALRGYPLGFYVPDMLDLMCTEYKLKDQIVMRGNGEMVLQLVQIREMRNRFEVGQLDKLLMIDRSGQGPVQRQNRTNIGLVESELLITTSGAVSNNVARSIVEEESRRMNAEARAAIDQSNESIRTFQRHVATVLRAVTAQKLSDDPKSWWNWWERYEESYATGPKYREIDYAEDRSETVYEAEEVYAVSYNVGEYYNREMSDLPMVPASMLPQGRLECLVAGTQVQTESGLKSVESIRVGDQVVSQDITSGELCLRPVLRTTVRPPAATREMFFDNGETIRSTLGHPWWVIGNGWVKTKDLKSGMSLRTSTGFAVIEQLKDAEASETFNLVVDKDHTYFVGQSRVLSFDASDPIPTFQRAPGLPAETLRQK